MEISWEEFGKRKDGILVDVRDPASYAYGHIPGAVNVPLGQVLGYPFPEGKEVVLYCRNGSKSGEAAALLCGHGVHARSLFGGYAYWLSHSDSRGSCQKAEESLRTRFHKTLFSRFAQAIVAYRLVEPGDRIAVCISGGKDSMLMAKLFQELKRHDKFPFELTFLVMDPGYSPANREAIEHNAELLQIPISFFETNIFSDVYTVEKSPCYLCARMRRGHLYHAAKERGCNKIALGHHYDDVIETVLMSMLYGGQIQTMLPKLDSTNFEGMQLIRPLYFVREEDIEAWRDANDLHFLQCACRFTEQTGGGNGVSKRLEVKKLIRRLRESDPAVEQNIFRSVENVNLATILGYKDRHGVRHRFDDPDA